MATIRQAQNPKQLEDEDEVLVDRNQGGRYTSNRAAKDHTPRERWESETAAGQPWNSVAAPKPNADWRECFRYEGTSSTKGQNVSVDEHPK